MKNFNSIAAAAAALEVKANTLSKQLKRHGNQVEMFDQKDREVLVKRNVETGEVTIYIPSPVLPSLSTYLSTTGINALGIIWIFF